MVSSWRRLTHTKILWQEWKEWKEIFLFAILSNGNVVLANKVRATNAAADERCGIDLRGLRLRRASLYCTNAQ
jgi:hypothetical protein